MNEFLEYLRVMKKRTTGTIAQYRSILKEFRTFEPVSHVSFSRYCEKISKNAPKTQKNKLMVVKEYLNWKADRGKIPAGDRYWNQADSPKYKRLPKAIDIAEVQEIIKDVLDAYTHKDVAKALAAWHHDEEVDDLYTSMFRETLTYMMEDPRNITPCTHLLFIAKNLERIGDHAKNICEYVVYMVRGKDIRHVKLDDAEAQVRQE